MLLAKSAIETSDDIHAYKPFVDGLRAVAIVSVIAGHLDLPGASGGFVGVDVFFVISGYLIINQILADIRKGRFSLLDFWARRMLRILPAFLLVVSVCLLLAVVVLVQFEYREFAASFVFSTLMQANHYFLAKQDYVDPKRIYLGGHSTGGTLALLTAETRPEVVAAVRALDRVLMSGSYVVPLFYVPDQWLARWTYIERPETTSMHGYVPETWWRQPKAQ